MPGEWFDVAAITPEELRELGEKSLAMVCISREQATGLADKLDRLRDENERLQADMHRGGAFGEILARCIHRRAARLLRCALVELEAASAEVYRLSERQTDPWNRLSAALNDARAALSPPPEMGVSE